uniref:SMP-30/Gluconolactonase/LRE-like region domain-containing protein n=1 Tax=Psilocybe cubensis TaxID=181762 RepID=A0A8H8CP10_PSICU
MPIHPAFKFALLLPILGVIWEYILHPYLNIAVHERKIHPVNNEYCKKVPQLAACEKIILHQQSGLLYLACSNPLSRVQWTPAVGRLNAAGASRDDFVAIYDPKRSTVTRLKIQGFESARGLSLHGMDVVESTSKPSELFVYLVNHRAPLGGLLAKDVGADSVIEIFKTTLGGDTLTHIKTVQDPIICTPNDIVGSPDGKSFYFTNDFGSKVGIIRHLDMLGRKSTSVGYCHIENGCHYAIQNMHGNNGIARAPNGTFYVANCKKGGLTILEENTSDNTLSIVDFVPADFAMDNLAVDSKGFVWAAAFPDVVKLVKKHFSDPTFPAPSAALRFSVHPDHNANTTQSISRYQVETVFEDDGNVASGITSAAYDADRNLLFLAGLASPNLVICKL